MRISPPVALLLALGALTSGGCATLTGRAAVPSVPAAPQVAAAAPAPLQAPSAAPTLPDPVGVQAAAEDLVAGLPPLELKAQGDGPQPDSAEDDATLESLLDTPTSDTPMEATVEAVADDLATTTHDIDIPLNARVLRYVELFTGRLRSFLEETLNRGAPFLPMIQDALRAEGLPTDLAFIPVVESAFKPTALSRAKARGLWQFMRGTAVENGLRHDWYVDERAEPALATVAAVRYLKSLYRTFGDWHLALASYNGGPGRVQKALTRSGKSDFWALTATSRYLPRETRDYVPLLLAAVIVARNPVLYGLTLTQAPEPAPFETLEVTSPIDLRRLSEAIGHPLTALQTLNPALRRWVTPPGTESFPLRVPDGTAEAAAAYVVAHALEGGTPFAWHTVRKGETLASIARKLKVKRQDLAEANFLSLRARVTAGNRLVVPRPPSAMTPGPAEREPVLQASAPPRGGATAASVHRVRKGDTLDRIARRYRTTVAELRLWNRLTGTVIRPGDRLTVRRPAAAADN